MKRIARIREIRQKLQNCKLYWFGNRASDGLMLKDLPELAAIAGLISQVKRDGKIFNACLEHETGIRVDLNTYDMDKDHRSEIETLRRQMHRLMRHTNVLVCYRPNAFISSIVFSNIGTCKLWGLPHLKQRAFEYKPWVENELSALDVRIIPWRHYSTIDWPDIFKDFDEKELVIRQTTGSGGAGINLVRSKEEIRIFCNSVSDGIVSVSAFMKDAIPISINAVVYRNGKVFLSMPSIQLIGLPESTRRYFGFCGNDFETIRKIPLKILDEMEDFMQKTGYWLSTSGYLGAFGVDFLIWENDLYFVELNPRFMASTPVSAQIQQQLDESDVYIEHLAAFAGLLPVSVLPLREKIKQDYDPVTQVIVYNKSDHYIGRAHVESKSGSDFKMIEEAPIGMSIAPEAQLFKINFKRGAALFNGKLDKDAKKITNLVTNHFVAGSRHD